MLTKTGKQWIMSLDLPTILMITLTLMAMAFSIITARSGESSNSSTGDDNQEKSEKS